MVGSQSPLKISFIIMAFITEPFMFRSPVNIYFRFPHIFTATAKTKGFKTHRFQGNISGENHQICPGNFISVLLLDRP